MLFSLLSLVRSASIEEVIVERDEHELWNEKDLCSHPDSVTHSLSQLANMCLKKCI